MQNVGFSDYVVHKKVDVILVDVLFWSFPQEKESSPNYVMETNRK